MALIKMGPIVSGVSGSIGGTVFSRNSGGAYIRARTVPLNPGSTDQTAVRQSLAYYANRWTTALTEAQRTAWSNYAANVPVKNRLGEDRFVSGLNMYTRANTLLARTGGTAVDDGPTTLTAGPSFTPTITVDAAADTFDIDAIPGAAGATDPFWLLVQQGVPQQAGVNFYKAPFRKMYATHVNATPFVAIADIPLIFPLTAGQAQFIRTATVSDDGRVGVPVVQRFLAA